MKAGIYRFVNTVTGDCYIGSSSERTGVKYNTIQKRLKNPNFGNYFYVKYPNKINNETIKIEEHD